MDAKNDLTWAEFQRVDLRVGTVTSAVTFPEARNPSYILTIDFGPEVGTLKTSAQITDKYRPEELVGRQVVAVVNFPPKQIANMMSECLVLGGMEDQVVTLLTPAGPVKNGTCIG